MSEQQLTELQQMTDPSFAPNNNDDDNMYEDVVNGREPLDISHAGGEMDTLTEVHEGLAKL